MGKTYFEQYNRKLAYAIGLPNWEKFRSHSSCRTGATQFAEAGGTAIQLQLWGGWSSPKVALGYVQDSTHSKRIAAKLLYNSIKKYENNNTFMDIEEKSQENENIQQQNSRKIESQDKDIIMKDKMKSKMKSFSNCTFTDCTFNF